MSRIASVFQNGKKALIAYITAGYPSIDATLETVPLLAESGCDIIELGIPFSDPLADGATIQKASYQALQNGVNPDLCLHTVEKLRRQVKIPLVFMTYYNPIFSYGLTDFCADCAKVGVDGLIVPDLPPEEGAELDAAASRENLDLIYLLAPTSTPDRIKRVAEKSRGFIYLVSVTGVTGARNELPQGLESFVTRVKKVARQPLCVGFGISTAEQAARVARIADGVIVGSRIVQLMGAESSETLLRSFIKGLRKSLDDLG